jgi:hypothetical protein
MDLFKYLKPAQSRQTCAHSGQILVCELEIASEPQRPVPVGVLPSGNFCPSHIARFVAQTPPRFASGCPITRDINKKPGICRAPDILQPCSAACAAASVTNVCNLLHQVILAKRTENHLISDDVGGRACNIECVCQLIIFANLVQNRRILHFFA